MTFTIGRGNDIVRHRLFFFACAPVRHSVLTRSRSAGPLGTSRAGLSGGTWRRCARTWARHGTCCSPIRSFAGSSMILRCRACGCRPTFTYRRIGPEKGVVHIATGAVDNALWDLCARARRKPLWKLLVDFTPVSRRVVSASELYLFTAAVAPLALGGARACCYFPVHHRRHHARRGLGNAQAERSG